MTKTCMKCKRTATLCLENNNGWTWFYCTQHAKLSLQNPRMSASVGYVSPAPGYVLHPHTDPKNCLPTAAREMVLRSQR